MSKRCNECSELKSDDAFRVRKNDRGYESQDSRCIECQAKQRRRQRKTIGGRIERKRSDRKQRRKRGVRPLVDITAEAEARRTEKCVAKEARKAAENAARIIAKPWSASWLTQTERFRMRYSLDPEFNLQQRIRAAMRRLKRGRYARIGCRLRLAIVNGHRISKTAEEVLGYTANDLKRHLERQFTNGMTWQAFCRGDIHIDHIVPLSLFNLQDDSEVHAAWALSNLQPLWERDNLTKRDRRTHLL